jgi:hypothetical protein
MNPPLALQWPEAIVVAPTRFRLMNLREPFVISPLIEPHRFERELEAIDVTVFS